MVLTDRYKHIYRQKRAGESALTKLWKAVLWTCHNPVRFLGGIAIGAVLGFLIDDGIAKPYHKLYPPTTENQRINVLIESVLMDAENDIEFGRHDEALAKVNGLIDEYVVGDTCGNFAELFFDLGYIHLLMDNGGPARQALHRSYNCDSEFFPTRLFLAKAYMLAGDTEDCDSAVSHFEWLVRKDPKNYERLKSLARAYQCSSDPDAACLRGRALYSTNTNNVEAREFLSSLVCM